MSAPHGASLSDWLHWDLVLGLTEDLLPVVCEPGLTISPTSKIVAYGKVPSRFDRVGHVIGFPKWTTYVTSEHDVTGWASDDRLGICLQTRHVRALDVDIEDFDAAQQVREALDDWARARAIRFAYRTRRDSAKFLTLFRLDGDYGKQVLHTPYGALELLMTGQQCVVAGRHPKGAFYEWEGGLDAVTMPTLTTTQFDALRFLFEELYDFATEWTAGRRLTPRLAGVASAVDDPVASYLRRQGLPLLIAEYPDRCDVACPWAGEHTSQTDASSTSWFPAGSGGFECGHFRCLHAHCAGRTTGAFLDAIGFSADGFTDLRSVAESAHALAAFTDDEDFIGDGEPPATVVSPIDGPAYDRDRKSGKIKPKLNNFLLWLRWMYHQGSGVSFDVFRDEYTLDTPQGRRDFCEQDYTRLQAQAEWGACGFDPLGRQMVRDAIRLAAQEQCYDSAQQWLRSLPPWDGVPRVDTFAVRYLGAADDAHSRAVSRYLWTAMPGRILHPGIQADMTLIMVSQQGTRKSSTIRAIAPVPDYFTEISFADGEADLARLTKGKTLVEIPELKGLRSRDIEWIKAFVTKRENSWVPKYFEMKTVYARRFLMIGTTNEQEFLADPTGERRWLPLTVGRQDDAAIMRDHAQLWAEGKMLFLTHGILWQDAQKSAQEQHQEYTIHDVLVDRLTDWLYQEDSMTHETPATRPFLRLLDVWRELWPGSNGVAPRADQLRLADALARVGYERCTSYVEKRMQKVWVKKKTALYHVEGQLHARIIP